MEWLSNSNGFQFKNSIYQYTFKPDKENNVINIQNIMPFNQCHLFSPSSKWKLIARCALVVLQSYLKQIARGKPIEFEEAGYSSLKCECSTSYPHFLDFGSILQCSKENVCHREARGTSAIEELRPTN